MSRSQYVGRFAPSPTGPLHIGSLVAAMASWLDARAHDGRWLIRMEDVDTVRSVPGAAEHILGTLSALGMHSDNAVMVQSARGAAYQAAFDRLRPHVFACACTRREIADSQSPTGADGAVIYPGTCRDGIAAGRDARAFRLRVPAHNERAGMIRFTDRWQGIVEQDLAREVGDFVLLRADGFWAYQLAVVVDDAAQGVTDVVRGADLLASTARQMYLQRLLGLPQVRYLHVPLVLDAQGEK
ncbi:MAG: tRNA glutamyl-Q(34) synthetase GluQRS, partial [Pseudomonadota bacterium]|nr:tRNA glutamyl-Q(34) synthetase GluQRS [Pseudomonadota bacterium]